MTERAVAEAGLRAGGATHAGNVRDTNEDCYLVAPDIGLYGVFDGMGGHLAGEVASALARDAVRDVVASAAPNADPRELLADALRRASEAVRAEAARRGARRGMGTTAVVCRSLARDRVLIAHVGDSRAYLWRDGRLQQLTADHTIVAELLSRGAITEEEARTHPYRSVLSRNLGASPDVRPDFCELELRPGDRLLLCSDGLTGYASEHAIAAAMGASLDPEQIARELVSLALKGGGGDNVTAVVVDAGQRAVPRRTQIVRTTGAAAWWDRRDVFLAAARELGVAQSPVCAVLSEGEAIDIVAGNLCEAVYRDLEQTTGIHVWTYAENLAAGWFDQGGDFGALRALLDALGEAAARVVAAIRADDPLTGALLAAAVPRALVVADIAVGHVIARRLREVERELADAEAARARAAAITETVTVPVDVPRSDPPPPDVAACLDAALGPAREAAADSQRPRVGAIATGVIDRAHAAARERGGALDGLLAARELLGAAAAGEPAVAPLLDALDRARAAHFGALARASATPAARAAALRRVAVAHRRIAMGVAHLVVDTGRPIADALREAIDRAASLRRTLVRQTSRPRSDDTQPGWAPPGGRR
ncbi:MAG: serine/threonine-protein phosphatase [Deltaproteobacteria bacterium]|nr:MAG: serine/threonine-protein phosphatase [Deltaproteobacteria bacterium]